MPLSWDAFTPCSSAATIKKAITGITAPFIVLMLFVINVMTSPGEWWVQWAAFGIGIAWLINLFKLIRDVVLLGGLAAFGAYIFNRNRQP